jgi:outer membrane protein insertion porin family
MKQNAINQGILRASTAGMALALFIGPALAQMRDQPNPAAAAVTPNPASNNAAAAAAANPAGAPKAAAAPAPQRTIQHINVTGTQRVETTTVLTYIALREGDPYDPAQIDQALKTLYATGLFSDVKDSFDPATATLTIRVVENPIINQVVFEGNSKVSDKDLTKEVEIKPRAVFTRAKVQADVARIIELYRRDGKFAARVDPQIIQRPQNRVDLIFSIHEGDTTGVARINFVGNKIFDANTLKGQIATEESAWYKFLASNDNYDPDRLAFDREQLRRFYVNHGYADFKVISAVAQLSPNRQSFYITFTVDEGPRYTFGEVAINSKIKELGERELRPLVPIKSGDIYDADTVQKIIDALTNAAGTKGYAFAEVHPRITRDRAKKIINMAFDIVQGPRVYIEKIDITGNTRTLDKVIRREFRLVEGDAFNRVLVDRSRTRIRSLGFFKDVEIKNTAGTQPDRTDVTVAVTEQSTGSLQLGLGYSSQSNLVGEFSYTEQNLFGKGQFLKAAITLSQITKEYTAAFTEPYFLDRPLAAGVQLFKASTNYQQATYQSDSTGGTLSLNFPVSEYSIVGLNYTYEIAQVSPYAGAPLEILLAAGSTYGSIFGYSYSFNTLDDARKPTKGFATSFSQGFSGFGGNLKFIKTTASFAGYHSMFADNVVGSLTLNSGYITGYDGKAVPINQRFFEGGDTFRGFKLAGIGPRDVDAPIDQGALGGNVFAIGTVAARLPTIVPESWGINLGVFTDFGTLGRVDNIIRTCTPNTASGQGTCDKDNLAFRATAGISFQWRSPFGPIQIDLALPYIKTYYDRPQIIHFSTATGF